MNHYFDADGLYTHTLPEGRGRIPRNARRVALPPTPWAGVWPRWSHGGRCWELVEDHRARAGVHAQEAALYRLPGDAADAPPRMMTRVGPLPEGATSVKIEAEAAEGVGSPKASQGLSE